MRWFMYAKRLPRATFRALRAIFWPPQPPILERLLRWLWISMLLMPVGPIGMLIIMYSNPGLQLGRYMFMWAQWAFMTPMIVVSVMTQLQRRRVRRAYEAAGGVLCAACLHPMAGLEQQSRCPECGRPYHPHADLELWRNAWIVARPPRESKP